MEQWESEFREWCAREGWASGVRHLIDRGLLRPVEAVPTGYDELKRASSIPNAARFEDGERPRAPDWTPLDGGASASTPAFTNEDADMLLARLDAAEAEIKALRERMGRLVDALVEVRE